MGILDDMFSGGDGLAKTLCETLGGTATIQFVTNRGGDEASNTGRENVTGVDVPFLWLEARNETDRGESGIIYNGVELTGIVPVAALERLPKPLVDRIVFQSVTYEIVFVRPNYVGNEPTTVRIGGKRL